MGVGKKFNNAYCLLSDFYIAKCFACILSLNTAKNSMKKMSHHHHHHQIVIVTSILLIKVRD